MIVRPHTSLKCAYHRLDDAIGICTRCSRPVCYTCYTKVRKRTYCKQCFDELFTGDNKPTEKPTIGGILGIISGITAVTLIGPISLHFILRGLGYGGLWATTGLHETNSLWYGYMVQLAWCPLGLMTILISKYALDRDNFWMAITGGVCATLAMPLLGIPALILIAKSKKEFKPH